MLQLLNNALCFTRSMKIFLVVINLVPGLFQRGTGISSLFLKTFTLTMSLDFPDFLLYLLNGNENIIQENDYLIMLSLKMIVMEGNLPYSILEPPHTCHLRSPREENFTFSMPMDYISQELPGSVLTTSFSGHLFLQFCAKLKIRDKFSSIIHVCGNSTNIKPNIIYILDDLHYLIYLLHKQ